MNQIGLPRAEIMKINSDSLIYYSLEYSKYNPSENALTDLVQSGRLQRINNDNLKNLLYQWSRGLKEADNQFDDFEKKTQFDIIPYLTKKYPLKNIDAYGRLKWKNSSKLKIDKLYIFEDLEYENLMDDLLYRLDRYNECLDNLKGIIESILKEVRLN